MTEQTTPEITPMLNRRQVLRIGGFTVATAAVIAACAGEPDAPPARIGQAPTGTALPDAPSNDVVLLRTATSIEYSLLALYQQMLGDANLLDAEHKPAIERFITEHTAHAAALEKLTTAAGGTAWTCGNPRLESALITPAVQRITNGDSAKNIPASDDVKRDMLNLSHGLESMAASAYQQLVGKFNDIALRHQAVATATQEARHAALLALTINTARPAAYAPAADFVAAGIELPAPADTEPAGTTSGPALTEIPAVTALPGQFGLLSSVSLVVGAGDENGVRMKALIDTPANNSYVYEYMQPSC